MFRSYTHLFFKAYGLMPNRLSRNRSVTSNVDHTGLCSSTTCCTCLSSPFNSYSVIYSQSPIDALMPYDSTVIFKVVSKKLFSSHSTRLRTSSNSRTHCLRLHDGPLKEKGDVLDAEADAFLADMMHCTYDQPKALTTTNVSAIIEDAYDSDVDEGSMLLSLLWPICHTLDAYNNCVMRYTSNEQSNLYHRIFLTPKPKCSTAVSAAHLDKLQGKDDIIRKLDAQISIMKVLNIGSTEGSCDQQALETDRIQLKDTITSLRIQLDGLKVENVSLKRRYDELSKANNHSRIAYTEKLSAFTAENTKLKAQVTGTTSSGPSTSETPKVLAPGMYNQRTHILRGVLRVKPTSGASKTVPKRAPRNHSSLPVKSANARRVEAHHRTLNKKNRVDSNLLVKHSVSVSNLNNVCGACNKSLVFANHTDCLVMCDGSVNVKPHQTKRFKRQPRKEWKPVKRVWKPISKPVANSKPQWKPTGRHFSLFEKYPLTRIMESTDMPIELPPSASSSPQITMVSRFTDHKLSDRKSSLKDLGIFKVYGTVRFGNDDMQLSLVGQFCDGGWEVASDSIHVTTPKSTIWLICSRMFNGKKYVLVIVDDYTRFGWVRFLRTKDETPHAIEKFIVKTQRALNATVRFVRTDNGTEFVNKTLDGWFESVAARTMLIFAKAPLFLWAEAVATACYTLNRSLIHTLYGKTYYELLKGKKPDLKYFRVFGSLCYPTNDYDDVGKSSRQICSYHYCLGIRGIACPVAGKLFVAEGSFNDIYLITVVKLHVEVLRRPHQPYTASDTNKFILSSYKYSKHFTGVGQRRTTTTIYSATRKSSSLQPEIVADNVPNAMLDGNTFVNPFAPPSTSADESSSSQYVDPSNMHMLSQPRSTSRSSGEPLIWISGYTKDLFLNYLDDLDVIMRVGETPSSVLPVFLILRRKAGGLRPRKNQGLIGAVNDRESGYVSLSACCTQVIWMRTQLRDYGFHVHKIPIYCESKICHRPYPVILSHSFKNKTHHSPIPFS
ncbi:retrovirus-related pol polyprotein from transposon TNT 1-94 [Tanacetum coccineum]